MNTTTRRQGITLLLLSLFATAHSQDLRSFNQNTSSSNHTRLSFAFSPGYSQPLNSKKDSLLFRGSGIGFRFGADYFFGKAGIGFSSGFNSASADDATINNFLKGSAIPLDQLTITKSRQQNMYFLVGPSFSTGNIVELNAHAKAGVFINNSGFVNIQQKGAQRAAYRNESTDKSLYPGFLTGVGVQYKQKSDVWSFGVTLDYMSTKSEVNNYDIRRGNGIEALKLSRNITDVIAGITIRYTILSPRDHASGQSTGRLLPTVNKREIVSPRDISSGQSTGRLLPTVNKREIVSPRDPASGLPTGRMDQSTESCGPVVQRITNPDGSTQEMTFSCPADAAQYSRATQLDAMPQRISTNRTVGKQTQNTTFGEKVNAGLTGIISGTLTWSSPNSTAGIISNKTITRGGSATMNSQTSSTRQTNQSSFGTMVRISAREASSGMASGRREASSGMATGRRQYESVFVENGSDVCDSCLARVKMSNIKNNPLYRANDKTTGNTIDENCDGISGVDVSLVDINSEVIIATTKTESCGDFFFANVPEGNYVVRLTATLTTKKGYDVYLKSKTDLLGDVEQSNESMQLTINTGNENSAEQPVSNTISIIEADMDGDGEFESLKATATLSDGSTQDVTADTKPGASGIVLQGNAFRMRKRPELLKSNKPVDPNAKKLSSVILSHSNNKLKATATYSDGSSQDVTDMLSSNTAHNNVRQYTITAVDLDGDGMAEAIINTSRSNIKSQRITNGNSDGDGIAEASINTTRSNIKHQRMADENTDGDGIWSPKSNRKMIPITENEVDGDGTMGQTAGNRMPTEFAIIRQRSKTYFETGDVPTSQQRPGAPIKGVIVKGGRNPSPDLIASRTNENGEFEFTGLDAGDYTFNIEQTLLLNDETVVFVRGDDSAEKNINTSESGLGKGDIKVSSSQNAQTLRAQNNNTVKSNRTELKSILVEADLDGDGVYETDITNKVNNEVTLDENGNIASPQSKAAASGIKITNNPNLQSIGKELYVSHGTAIINNKEVAVQSVLKTKHDTVKNSIGNIR